MTRRPPGRTFGMEVAGAAAAKLVLGGNPYRLSFQSCDDRRGRIRKGDIVLISQSEKATIHVVRNESNRRKVRYYLARRAVDCGWIRLFQKKPLPGDCPAVGQAMGVIWSSLM